MKEGVKRLLAIILAIVLFAVSLVTALSMLELDNLSASAGNVITSNTPESPNNLIIFLSNLWGSLQSRLFCIFTEFISFLGDIKIR